jgi:acyl dehydratase
LPCFLSRSRDCPGKPGFAFLGKVTSRCVTVKEIFRPGLLPCYEPPPSMEAGMRVFASAVELAAAAGSELGVSRWVEVTQERIDQFAQATGDRQWIHVDPERARRESPYGTTVAHGYLTLSMLPVFIYDVIRLEAVRQSVNYGSNRVRFPAPVRAGSRLRGRIRLAAAEPMEGGGLRATLRTTVELEGSDRPACVAETMAIHYW